MRAGEEGGQNEHGRVLLHQISVVYAYPSFEYTSRKWATFQCKREPPLLEEVLLLLTCSSDGGGRGAFKQYETLIDTTMATMPPPPSHGV